MLIEAWKEGQHQERHEANHGGQKEEHEKEMMSLAAIGHGAEYWLHAKVHKWYGHEEGANFGLACIRVGLYVDAQ